MRVFSGEAERWTRLRRIRIAAPGAVGEIDYEVERSRAYRDRLVLKLRQVDAATTAAELRGRVAWALADEIPRLPEGEHYQTHLIGLEVFDRQGERLGRVVDVVETAGTDLLKVVDNRGGEILVPLAREVIEEVSGERGRIVARLPEGLRELNAPEGKSR